MKISLKSQQCTNNWWHLICIHYHLKNTLKPTSYEIFKRGVCFMVMILDFDLRQFQEKWTNEVKHDFSDFDAIWCKLLLGAVTLLIQMRSGHKDFNNIFIYFIFLFYQKDHQSWPQNQKLIPKVNNFATFYFQVWNIKKKWHRKTMKSLVNSFHYILKNK